jgi:Domain of unknown function (DUF4399)
MKRTLIAAAAVALTALVSPTFAQQTASPAGAQVYFVNIQDGATVTSPVKIVMGLSGMGVAPAGVEKANTGHHHILVNRAPIGKAKGGAAEFQENIIADDNHRHFGNGQTEMMLELKAGTHTLQLVLGDHNHIPHNPPVVSPQITITVK